MNKIIRQTVLKLGASARVSKRRLRQLVLITCSIVVGFAVTYASQGSAQTSSSSVCSRPPAGSVVNNPPEIRNPDASNPANFTVLSIAPGQNCYLANGDVEAPTLRLNPGKKDLVLRLTNQLPASQQVSVGGMAPRNSTNLHYHGLNVSPTYHQDEVVKTVIKPNDAFEFDIIIPDKEPPGMYWYHPHVHMQSEGQVLSGLTGAIIIEGIKEYNNQAANLPERVFVLRDMELLQEFPNDTEQPAKDISINSVPIRYQGAGQYDPPAVIKMKPNQEQFWRVANTAADTYFDLQVTYDGTPQQLGLVAMDGVPINADGGPKDQTLPVRHILLPPAGRAEFIIKGPSTGVKNAEFLTLKYDRNADNDPGRTIARIDTQAQLTAAAELSTSVAESSVDATQVSGDRFTGISQMNSIRQRTLYFSQTPKGAPKEEFYITEKGKTRKVYDPNFTTPDITVQEGTTEDWIIENLSPEAHAFHIHQIHFLVLESPNSREIGMIRDTINLPVGGRVILRMDFRGAQKGSSIAGTFVYHCHILEHEDGGMMGSIEVKSA